MKYNFGMAYQLLKIYVTWIISLWHPPLAFPFKWIHTLVNSEGHLGSHVGYIISVCTFGRTLWWWWWDFLICMVTSFDFQSHDSGHMTSPDHVTGTGSATTTKTDHQMCTLYYLCRQTPHIFIHNATHDKMSAEWNLVARQGHFDIIMI